MTYRHTLALAFFTVLTACKGSCSCGTDDGDDGQGGSDPTSTSPASTSTGTPSSSSGAGGDDTTSSSSGNTATSSSGGDGGSGGAGSGGSGGAGSGGAGGAGGGPETAARECLVAEDCQLLDDCCSCDAIPASETPEECLAQCLIPKCQEKQRPKTAEVACVAGRCVAGFECNWALVVCDQAPPECPAGETASVLGGCFGPCVPATECVGVATCDQCDGGLACVQQSAFTTSTHCVTHEPCAADDCACLGPSVCTEGDACFDESGVVTCECITC